MRVAGTKERKQSTMPGKNAVQMAAAVAAVMVWSLPICRQAQAQGQNADASGWAQLARAGASVERAPTQLDAAAFTGTAAKLPLRASAPAGEDVSGDYAQDRADRESALFDEGMQSIDDAKWERAIDRFERVAEMHGKHADEALYYVAWSQKELGHRAEALSTLASLEKDYPQSTWIKDAKALEIEIQQSAGNTPSPEAQSDCELKLLALNGLEQADPTRAVPILEKMLHGGDCPKLANQALFVLAQSGSPEARQVIVGIATGGSNPELQHKAIQDLGLFSGKAGRETLLQIYSTSTDTDVKKYVLNAFMLSGARDEILNAAKNEKNPELRAEAIRQMGLMGAREDIWQLYQTESSLEVKKSMLQAIWLAGDHDHVAQLALNEKDKSLRLAAINDLGLMGKPSEPTLVQIYSSDPDPEIKQKVISALFIAGDAKALVDLARKETNPEMKKKIVSQLALMNSKEATDYLMEILNK
jgi:HEAT repeat protein